MIAQLPEVATDLSMSLKEHDRNPVVTLMGTKQRALVGGERPLRFTRRKKM
jgi:hypothetical protein